MFDDVLSHDLALKLRNLAALLLDALNQFIVLVLLLERDCLMVGTDSALLTLTTAWLLARRVMHLGILRLTILVDDLWRLGVGLAHLARAEVAVDEDVVEGRHRTLWMVLSEGELILRVVLQCRSGVGILLTDDTFNQVALTII